MSQKIQMYFLSFIALFLLSTLATPAASAQDEPALLIEIYDSNDWNESAGSVVYEGRSYDIMVSTENETVVLDVNISVLGVTYVTNMTEPFITIIAPDFDDTESFVINASKLGYQTAEVEVTVMIGRLSVVADRGTVEEKKEFQVRVTDQDNNPVKDASVYITPESLPVITDLQGIAYIPAPDVEMETTINIQVAKGGYYPGSTKIRVENAEGFAFILTESQFLKVLPILLAVLVVIFSIVYVVWRQRRSSALPPPVSRGEKQEVPRAIEHETQGKRFKNESAILPEKDKRDAVMSTQTSRVEEIRIPVQAKKKETTILAEERDTEPASDDQKKDSDEWFKGQDYMRYKLDELTGAIDQKTDGKWFEGEHDIKYKVDETLRKSSKKKKIEEDDGK